MAGKVLEKESFTERQWQVSQLQCKEGGKISTTPLLPISTFSGGGISAKRGTTVNICQGRRGGGEIGERENGFARSPVGGSHLEVVSRLQSLIRDRL